MLSDEAEFGRELSNRPFGLDRRSDRIAGFLNLALRGFFKKARSSPDNFRWIPYWPKAAIDVSDLGDMSFVLRVIYVSA